MSWDDQHAIAHVLLNKIGPSIPFLAEGMAVYVTHPSSSDDVHQHARELVKASELIPINKLLAPRDFEGFPSQTAHAQAGSFVGFLVERHGIESFKKLYPCDDAATAKEKLPERFRQIYGHSLEDVEQAWRAFLLKSAPQP